MVYRSKYIVVSFIFNYYKDFLYDIINEFLNMIINLELEQVRFIYFIFY